MLIDLPPGLETAAHARRVIESVLDEKGSRAQTAVPMITVDDHLFGLVGALQELLDIAIVQADRSGNMRLFVRTRIAYIDEQGRLLVQLLFRIVYLNLWNFHRSLPLTSSFYQADFSLSTVMALAH